MTLSVTSQLRQYRKNAGECELKQSLSFLLLHLRSIAEKNLVTLPAVHYTPNEMLTTLTTSLHLRRYS